MLHRICIFLTAAAFLVMIGSCDGSFFPNKVQDQKLPSIAALQSSFLPSELQVDSFPTSGDTSRVAVFGHVHSLMEFPDLLEEFVQSITDQNPDYVMALGDVVFYNDLEEWEMINKVYAQIKCPVYFLPGNHDINFYRDREVGELRTWGEAESRYLDQVGYRYKTIVDHSANYILLNFNDSLGRVKDYLAHAYAQIDTTKETLVFTHQYLWDPKLSTKEKPKMWTAKKWKGQELEKSLKHMDVLIHGDWNVRLSEGNRELNGKPLKTYAVGSRMRRDPLSFTMLEVTADGISAEAHELNIDPESAWFE